MNFTELKEQLEDAGGGVLTNHHLNESAIRNIGAAALVAKVNALGRSIQSIRMNKNDKEADRHMKIFRQNKLLSKQHLWISVLIAQLNIMKDKEDKR